MDNLGECIWYLLKLCFVIVGVRYFQNRLQIYTKKVKFASFWAEKCTKNVILTRKQTERSEKEAQAPAI